jgi:SSS family solute:Na+ symporter
MNWFIFWITLYFILILYLIIRHIRKESIEQYLINNRNTRLVPLVFTTLATFVGGGVSVGLMAVGYEAGFAGIAIGVAFVIGFFITARFAREINITGRRLSIYSFAQFLNKSFTKKEEAGFARLFSSVVSTINIFIFFFLLSAQFVGMASLIKDEIGLGYNFAAVLSCLLVIIYTAFAGLAGVIITDMIQFIVIVIMMLIILLPGIHQDTDGLILLSDLPTDMLNGTSYGLLFLIGLPLFLAPSVIVRMDIWQRLLSAKDAITAKKASIWSGLGMLPFYIIFPLAGMAVRLIAGDTIEPKYATHMFLTKHCNEFLLGFAVVGLVSALMSSGDSFLNIISISAIKDYIGWKGIKTPDKSLLHSRIRWAVIFFGFLALAISLVIPRIVDLMVVGTSVVVIFVPVTFLALLNKGAYRYRKSALLSIGLGFGVNLIFFIYGTFSDDFEAKSSFVPGFLTALLVMICGYYIEKRLSAK